MDRPPHLRRTERLRRWLTETGPLLLVAAALVILAILGILAPPRRIGQPVDGEVVRFIWYGRGFSLSALVRAPDGEYLVHIQQSDGCKIGDRIRLIPFESPAGRSYGPAFPTPCSAGTHK